jgi:iron complex outermembrane receptor protein
MRHNKLYGLSVLAIAIAQPTRAAETPSADIGDIIVTAQRREQSLQKVPLAVTAFGTVDLAQRQIRDTIDLIRFIPNLVGNNNVGLGSSNTYYIRGIGNTESIATQDVPVGTYVDDIFVARQNANNFGLFDVERIEVLRGPQGTLFGRNTTGGAINVILRKPSNHVTGYVEGTYGSFNRRELRGSIDLPANQKVLTKLSAFYRKDDGYVRQLSTGNELNYLDSKGVRAAVRLLPTDQLTIDLSADYVDETNSNLNNYVLPGSNERVTSLGIIAGALTPFFVGDKRYNIPGNQTRSWSVTNNIKYNIGDVTLNSITGYRHLVQRYYIDSTLAPPNPVPYGLSPILDYGSHQQVSQEFKASGALLDDRLSYVTGLFYLSEDNVTDLGTGVGTATAFRLTGDRTLHNTLETYAVYSQADFKLASKLTLTAGIRYTYERKKLEVNTNPGAAGPLFSTSLIQAASIPTTLTGNFWTPRFALTYQIDSDIMVYASATRGAKSGGWNGRALTNNLFLPFLAEKVWSEEVGLRAQAFDRRVRLNLTSFYLYDTDVQISAASFVNGARIFTTTNPADLRNYGLEGELTIEPVKGLNLGLGFGVQHARYTHISTEVALQASQCQAAIAAGSATGASANCARGFVDFRGSIARPVRTPELTLTGNASYRITLPTVAITPAADISYYGAFAIGNAGSPNSTDGSYTGSQTLVDASLTFEPLQLAGLSFTVDCKNCLDRAYHVSFLSPTAIYINPPRTWSVRAGYRF